MGVMDVTDKVRRSVGREALLNATAEDQYYSTGRLRTIIAAGLEETALLPLDPKLRADMLQRTVGQVMIRSPEFRWIPGEQAWHRVRMEETG